MNIYEYSHLRLRKDPRPNWARNLGLHSLLLNNDLIEYLPRLKYKRKLGSHIAPEKADEDYINKETKRFEKSI